MIEARRIPPKAPTTDAPAGRADAPTRPAGNALQEAVHDAVRAARTRVVGRITPSAGSRQVRAAEAWRAWVRAEAARREAAAAAARPPVSRAHAGNAEVLLWQNRMRLAFVGAATLVALALRLLGVLRPSPVAAGVLGAAPLAAVHLSLVLAYALGVAATQRRVAARGAARTGAVAALVLGDLALGFATAFLLAPPQYYARALLLAFFSLQLTQTFFGRRVGASAIVGAAVGYAALCVAAHRLGAPVVLAEEAWTLALFVAGATASALVQGGFVSRVNGLVELFERAEGGDFSQAYDEAAEARPDAVTRVGRAYNRMRVQLSTIVLTDPLSGCLNRRGFDLQLAREVARAARAREEIALIAVDVDYFKRINDTFGHLAGDAVIREVGALLREATRTSDVVARVGGEEFLVLAPGTGAAGAFNVATRIVEEFRRRRFEGVAGRIPVTVSAGVVADVPPTGHAAEDFKGRADEALYAAKRGGRNRVSVWTPELRHNAATLAAAGATVLPLRTTA